jgi:hypothetical protein
MTSLRAARLRMIGVFLITTLFGCAHSQPRTASEAGFGAVGGIKDMMRLEVDPSADAIWESVSTVGDATGIHENMPRSDKEWSEVRDHAVVLAESANLLAVSGRRVTVSGQRIDGEGAYGNLTTDASERAIVANRAEFLAFAQALRVVAIEIIQAADAKDVRGILEKGEVLDGVCESCHLKFWYPPSRASALK